MTTISEEKKTHIPTLYSKTAWITPKKIHKHGSFISYKRKDPETSVFYDSYKRKNDSADPDRITALHRKCLSKEEKNQKCLKTFVDNIFWVLAPNFFSLGPETMEKTNLLYDEVQSKRYIVHFLIKQTCSMTMWSKRYTV